MTVSVLTDRAALLALAEPWWALWRRCPNANPFTSPAWLLPWLDAFAPASLRTLAVSREGRLVGLAPLWLEEGPLGRRLLPLGIGLSDLFDVLLDPEAPEAGEALAAALAAMPGWDACEFEALPPGAAAAAVPRPGGCREEEGPPGVRPVLALPSPLEDPLCGLPAGKRRKLRMTRHRAGRRHARLVASGPGETDAFLADLTRLHGLRWMARQEPGVLADPRVLAFQAAALPRLAEAGLARLHRVVIEERVVGAYYGLAFGDAAYAYLGGFDPDFAFESPGTLLLGHAIEEAAYEGRRRFDFLRGAEPYKYEWGARDEPNRHRRFVRIAGGG